MISKQEKDQYTKLRLDQVIHKHKLGFLTSTGLVHFYFEIKLAYGWKTRFSPKEIYEMLGISKSAFYKAIASLTQLGYISYEVHGEMTVSNTNPDTVSSVPYQSDQKPDSVGVSDSEKAESQIVDSQSQIVDSQSQIVDSESQIVDSESQIVDRKTLKPAQGKHLGSPTDLYNTYYKFLPSFLQETGEGESELICFFEWMDKELWPTFETPVKYPCSWLKSIDPETEQPRFWTQWAAYQFQKKTSERRKNGAICRNYEAEWQKVLGLSATMSYGQTSDTLIKDPLILEAVKFAGGLYTIGTADFSATPKHKAAFISKLRELDENATLSSFLPENSEISPLAED